MRSPGKIKIYSRGALQESWISASVVVWLWEAAFLVPGILAFLRVELIPGTMWLYSLIALGLAGPTTYLVYRYFYRMVNYVIINSDNFLMRVVTVLLRSVLGLVAAVAFIWLVTLLIDWCCFWVPVILRYIGAELPQLDLRWHEQVWTVQTWWWWAVLLSAMLPVYCSQVWLVLIDDPHADLINAFKYSFNLMRGHVGELCGLITSFWMSWLLAIAAGVGLTQYARSFFQFTLGVKIVGWMYGVGIAITAAPVIAYLLTSLACFFLDLKEDDEREKHPLPKSATAEWVDDKPARTREQIQADLLATMQRRQVEQSKTAPQTTVTTSTPVNNVRVPARPEVTPSTQPAFVSVNAQQGQAGQNVSEEPKEEKTVSDYAAPVGEAMMGEVVGGEGF